MKNAIITALMIAQYLTGFAQGLISTSSGSLPECGSHEYMKYQDSRNPGFMDASDSHLKEMSNHSHQLNKKTDHEVLQVEVVFHVVYNSPEENIPDSVIQNQLRVLNDCYRRRNADTSDMRTDFEGLVGDTRIEFVLASRDPQGNPTNGITRTNTSIEHFGGILPHKPGENQKITQWVQDSFYSNLGRISQTDNGGIDPWNTDKYLNIWIGDMRIFEPEFNNFEEIVFFALATPPMNHPSWSDFPELADFQSNFNDGVYLHYNVVGPNNPAQFKQPYDAYNNLVTGGKLLVHEIGHYLGLRHIWGDGGCAKDDYVEDTPRGTASSNFGCSKSKNTCTDDINGKDLPDMIENYMDYSSNACQNSFTKGQVAIMRQVVRQGRGGFASVDRPAKEMSFDLYPNPAKDELNIMIPNSDGFYYIFQIRDALGRSVYYLRGRSDFIHIPVALKPGMYMAEVITEQGIKMTQKLVITE